MSDDDYLIWMYLARATGEQAVGEDINSNQVGNAATTAAARRQPPATPFAVRGPEAGRTEGRKSLMNDSDYMLS
jgi:hypothetical protein